MTPIDRRDFLLRGVRGAVGLSGLAAIAAACSDSGTAKTAPEPTAPPTAPPTTAPIDPDVPWWLQGNFAPVTTEVEATDLAVKGSIPRELSGLYVRNGSNPLSGVAPHWFLGDGMLHGLRLEDGNASWYRNRYVRTALYDGGGGLTASGAPGGPGSLSNVSIYWHHGKLLSLGEVGGAYEIAPSDLSTVGYYDFGGRLPGSVTAHPKIDPETGLMHFFGYEFSAPFLNYYVADATGNLITNEPVGVSASTMIHDFAITDRDVIFWEFPILFDFDLAIEMVSDPQSDIMPYVWTPSYGSRVGVMPLGGPTSAIRWVDIENAYVFHGVNAWREGDDVCLDVCRLGSVFEDGDTLGRPPVLNRWRINTAGDALTFRDEVLADRPADLPNVDRRQWGRPYRHSWRVETTDRQDTVEMRGVVHYDAQTEREQTWDPGPTRSSGEWLFVPNGDGEGEGFVMSYVHDAADDKSSLVILDAQDVSAGPLAEIQTPQRVPYGFHATWVPVDEM